MIWGFYAKVTEQVRGSNFFKIEIFSDHKLYDLGYLLPKKKKIEIFFCCGVIANFVFCVTDYVIIQRF